VLSDVRLRVVPIDSIRPHEIADPGREARIERRIAGEGMLRDPLLVGAVTDVDGYVLLDGTNRHVALQRLGVPLALVQVIDYADHTSVQLYTWCHSAPVPAEDLAHEAERIEGLRVTSLPPLGAQDALSARDTLAVILDRRQRFRVAAPGTDPVERLAALRPFVDLYEHYLTRVDCNLDIIEEEARSRETGGTGTALIAFPPITRGQVVAMAIEGVRIPAGITRHVILGGRALRVNLPLELLATREVKGANEALLHHLDGLHPRTYHEPTVLFDS
jgi:hypothetical protein